MKDISHADKALQEAVEVRVRIGNKVAIEALRELINWVPEGKFPLKKGVYDEDPTADDLHAAPVCCEAYAYALWGKEDARSFLANLNEIARALGVDNWRDLQGPAPK